MDIFYALENLQPFKDELEEAEQMLRATQMEAMGGFDQSN